MPELFGDAMFSKRLRRSFRTQGVALAVLLICRAAEAQTVSMPAAITAEGVPPIPQQLADETTPYKEARAVLLATWNPKDRSMLISTRLGSVAQLHRVAVPLGMRRQISFEREQIRFGSYAPVRGDVLLVQKDMGGNEFFQLYTLSNGRLKLLTDGKSRNLFGAWSKDGRLVGYSSTRRNGTDTDLYVMDPRDPQSDRMVFRGSGGGWQIRDFTSDGRTALVTRTQSVAKTDVYELDLAKSSLRPVSDPKGATSYRAPQYAPDGTLWVISDEGSDFLRLGRLDRVNGRFAPVAGLPNADVDMFDVSADGRVLAIVVNALGVSQLSLLNHRTGAVRVVRDLPAGLITGIDIAPWGPIALTATAAKYPLDAFSVDPVSLKVTQWTQSETGGLDPAANVEPELVSITSFDGLPISGFLYRPDPVRFPGRRPLIVDIHGGPEAQSRPLFLYENNYLLNELGIARFYPNVRGSSGFGKRFLSLDNGPYLRENAVKDIGAFLNHLRKDSRLDDSRFGVTGASYGGYMCYASAISFGEQLRAAACEVAVSNIVTVLESMESYRRDLRRPEYGDERDPAQRAKLLAISPLTRANEIKIPLLVVTGANDPRVPKSEAEQIVKAVRANGREVWHLIAANEGHGFVRKENDDYRFLTTLLFWKQHLLAGP